MSRPRTAFFSPLAGVAGLVALLGLTALVACGPPSPATAPEAPQAGLFVAGDVPDASVWVDGRYVGSVEQLEEGVSVAAGARRIEVRHDDYHTFYERLELKPGERRRLRVHLAPELP